MIITLIIIFVLLLLDQITKYFTMINVAIGEKIEVIPYFLTITKTYNTGAAWGSFGDSTAVLVVISLIGSLFFIFLITKNNWKNNKLFSISSTLLLTGCYGNLIDRFLSVVYNDSRPGVVDMISFEPLNIISRKITGSSFPIFNLADSYLVIGVILFIVYILFFEGKKNERNKDNK